MHRGMAIVDAGKAPAHSERWEADQAATRPRCFPGLRTKLYLNKPQNESLYRFHRFTSLPSLKRNSRRLSREAGGGGEWSIGTSSGGPDGDAMPHLNNALS